MFEVEAREGIVRFLAQALEELRPNGIELGTGGGKGLVCFFFLIDDAGDLPYHGLIFGRSFDLFCIGLQQLVFLFDLQTAGQQVFCNRPRTSCNSFCSALQPQGSLLPLAGLSVLLPFSREPAVCFPAA